MNDDNDAYWAVSMGSYLVPKIDQVDGAVDYSYFDAWKQTWDMYASPVWYHINGERR